MAVFTWCISSCPLRSFASTAFPGHPHSLHSLLVHSTRNIIIILLWVYQTRFLYITMNVWDSIRQRNLLPAWRSRSGGTTQSYATKKWTQKHKVWHNINSWESKVIWIRLLQKRQPNITHRNQDISNESKWAAKSESVFSKLIPFKNFHVWWILLVSQTRLLDPHQTDL